MVFSEKEIDEIFDRDLTVLKLLEDTDLMIAVNDKEGFFRRLSRGWERVTGFTVDELTSKPWSYFLHPDDLERSMKQYREGELFNDKAENFKGFTNRYKVKNGGWVELEWHSTGQNIRGFNLAIAIPRKYYQND